MTYSVRLVGPRMSASIIRDELLPLLELKEAPEAMQRLLKVAAEVAHQLTDR